MEVRNGNFWIAVHVLHLLVTAFFWRDLSLASSSLIWHVLSCTVALLMDRIGQSIYDDQWPNYLIRCQGRKKMLVPYIYSHIYIYNLCFWTSLEGLLFSWGTCIVWNLRGIEERNHPRCGHDHQVPSSITRVSQTPPKATGRRFYLIRTSYDSDL